MSKPTILTDEQVDAHARAAEILGPEGRLSNDGVLDLIATLRHWQHEAESEHSRAEHHLYARAQLQADLKTAMKYAKHDRKCPSRQSVHGTCNCGYAQKIKPMLDRVAANNRDTGANGPR